MRPKAYCRWCKADALSDCIRSYDQKIAELSSGKYGQTKLLRGGGSQLGSQFLKSDVLVLRTVIAVSQYMAVGLWQRNQALNQKLFMPDLAASTQFAP